MPQLGDDYPVPYERTFDGTVGFEITEVIASEATAVGVWDDGKIGLGLANHTNFLRPVTGGVVVAEARRRHAGRTTWVWDVDMRDDQGRLCASSRVTIAVRDRPRQGAGLK